jgi:hypothetical protein
MRRWRWLAALLVLAGAWGAYGLWLRARRAPRPPPPSGEMRGAWHVHTVKSDGRGTLDEVVRAAREAGLQFVVVADHNVLELGDAGWRDGVLVVPASEISAPYGHVAGIGLEREVYKDERQKDTLGTIATLGGEAVLAHPFHPGRPFTRWTRDDWQGLEVVSNDSAWGRVVRDQAWWRLVPALLQLPFDPGRAVLAFFQEPVRELARLDAAAARRRVVLLCASDAHGWPSYRAAFEAFSMHVPVTPSGDSIADVDRVRRALLDGSAWCVLDAVAPASSVRLSVAPSGDRIDLGIAATGPGRPTYHLFRDGAPVGTMPSAPGGATWNCGGPCPAGAWRVEGRRDGAPWLFTNPIWIE